MKKISANSIKVRQINRSLILDALKDNESANISELASITGLSIATCANILPDLMESGEATELVAKESSGGRPARRFAFNPNHTLIASFLLKHGLGRPEIVYSVSNAAGKTVSIGEKSVKDLKLEHLDALFNMVKTEFNVKAVAVAIPGVVSNDTILVSDIPDLVGIRLEEHIRTNHNLQAVIDNDMNFAAIGYHKLNSISPAGLVFLAFPADRCPGAGLVVNSMLIKGKTNFAGEIDTITPYLMPPKKGSTDKFPPNTPKLMGRTAAVMIATLNPDIIVVSGEAASPEMHDAIQNACLETIPPQHMPKLIIQPSYEKECFLGMQTLALNTLSNSYELVEKSSAWC